MVELVPTERQVAPGSVPKYMDLYFGIRVLNKIHSPTALDPTTAPCHEIIMGHTSCSLFPDNSPKRESIAR